VYTRPLELKLSGANLLRNVSGVTDGFPSLVLSTVICVDCKYNLIERGQCEYSASGSDRAK